MPIRNPTNTLDNTWRRQERYPWFAANEIFNGYNTQTQHYNVTYTEEPTQMNYEQLKQRHPSFVDRYFPFLSIMPNAVSALAVIDRDLAVTQVERDALREYVGRHTTPSIYNYKWCEECESMIGLETHIHCPRCSYAVFQATDNVAPHIALCHNCTDCCVETQCRICPGCTGHCQSLCRHCGKCNVVNGLTGVKCCVCVICTSCGSLEECDDCHRCYNCCNCQHVRSNGCFGKVFLADKKSDRKKFLSKRLAGVEWEFNTSRSKRPLNKWVKEWYGEIHHDGSCGDEAVTAPIAGDYIEKCVSALGEAFKQGSVVADNRCSIHVHVDAKDIYWIDMYRLLTLYSKLEPILYLIAGQDRLANQYCKPCGVDYLNALNRRDSKEAIMRVAFGLNDDNYGSARETQRGKPGKKANGRYKGLNICPWLAGRTKAVNGSRAMVPDTTIEFRIHKNTLDPIRVSSWAKLCVHLIDWVAMHTDDDLKKLPSSPLRILCENVAPDLSKWILSSVKEWRKEYKKTNKGTARRKIICSGGKYKF